MDVGPRGAPPGGVTPLARRDLPRAGQVLGRAFSADPLWSMLVPDTKLRGAMFTGGARMVAAGGGTVEATRDGDGVALWMPPGKRLGMATFIKSGLAPLQWLVRTPRQDLKRLMALQRTVDLERKALISGPHWCLEVLGVDPDCQGRGLGSALVEAGLSRADRDNVPTYVDTTSELNVDFYSRFGFEVKKEITVTDLKAPFWMMIRPAVG